MSERPGPEGLGGWLILVGLGVVLSPFIIAAQTFPVYSEIFANGHWEILTTPGYEVYRPLWAPIIIIEITINSGLILFWAFLAFLFFSKRILFPKCYIGIFVFTIVFIIADAVAVKVVLPNEPVFDPETIKLLVRIIVQSVIWIPYMLVSKRVKATFVR